MIEERFIKYINEIENGITSEVFLEENRKIISHFKQDIEAKKQFKIHKALSNLKRFLIYNLLKEKPMCTCALAKVFQTSEGTISHHLKILQDAGKVIGMKESYFTTYYTIENLIQSFDKKD